MSVSMRLNDKHKGIELLFSDDSRPNKETRDKLKENGFRWHTAGKYWFARQTESRLSFAKELTGQQTVEHKEPEQPAAMPSEPSEKASAKPSEKVKNTFAENYDSIGDISILESANVNIFSLTEAYFKHAEAYYGRRDSGETIYVTDLSNAGRTGKTCTTYTIRHLDWNGNAGLSLANDEGISTCQQLIDALRSGRTFDSLQISKREEKGVEVFSPFAETKPLTKVPDVWNKRNFTSALLSGQIYKGTLDQRLTDDYAYDAAYNFGEGTPLNIPMSAKKAVEDWSSLASIRMGKEIKEGVYEVDYYDGYSSSKTFLFDLNCDIREGKRRHEEYWAGVEQYNKMMESACLDVPQDSIDAGKIYIVTTLERGMNSGVYAAKDEIMQGHDLRYRLDPEENPYMSILGVTEMEIEPSALYEVANFHHRRGFANPDDRIAECGNYSQYVTGKALLELTAEGVYFPKISKGIGEYRDIEAARKTLQGFINGTSRYMFTGASVDYEKALETLNREYNRALGIEPEPHKKGNLDDIIAGAKSRVVQFPGKYASNEIDFSH